MQANMKNNTALVSVIMPAYRCEAYIGQAIESVLAQNVDLELIIINDASPDHLDDVISPYLSDSRLIYQKNEKNLGVSETRNRGIALAKGEYIALLDADDYWTADKLEKQLIALQNSSSVLCGTARELVRADGTTTGRIIGVKPTITYSMLLYSNSINCSSVLVKADVLKKFPMHYDDAHEDYITWLKILKDYGNAIGINEPLLKYRLSENGKSRNKGKSAKMHFKSLKYAGFGNIKAAYYFCLYAIHGVLKYFF